MQRVIIAILITLIAAPVFAAEEPKTEEQKTLYAIGTVIARQLSVFNLTPSELELIKQGLTDAVTGKKPLVDEAGYTAKIQELATARRNAQGEKLAAEAKEYVEKTAKEKGAVKAASGMIYLPIKDGSGTSPKTTDKVKVNYRGTLVNGQEFDSSYKRGQAAEFPLNQVIPCWTEGLQMMKTGGKAKLICPPEIAYGKAGSGAIPPNATLVFEVELLDIVK
ncbi:FKBP-type peptidyl-prolyl cis-trans isomerase [Geotalea toluenoxydans]|uniref:FKBP-type peptidyl-prolyl cis-trans isomerase n=1 Tax=Geotalea toluenoxydans TaxID=421624 RepID=UPI0006D219F4|nr:FKBP-type peptidyl-prolyl cis-trans isomerase [Geotalea toluenoxydans]